MPKIDIVIESFLLDDQTACGQGPDRNTDLARISTQLCHLYVAQWSGYYLPESDDGAWESSHTDPLFETIQRRPERRSRPARTDR